MEALNGGSIPVILAEGWELPLNELIDWEQISVQRPEALGLDPEALVSSLPRDHLTIEGTRSKVREVYSQIFETQEQRLTSLLRSAALWKRNWQSNERETLRMLVEKVALNLILKPGLSCIKSLRRWCRPSRPCRSTITTRNWSEAFLE